MTSTHQTPAAPTIPRLGQKMEHYAASWSNLRADTASRFPEWDDAKLDAEATRQANAFHKVYDAFLVVTLPNGSTKKHNVIADDQATIDDYLQAYAKALGPVQHEVVLA